MKDTLIIRSGISKYWWIPLITGLLSLGLGIWTIFSPLEALPVLAMTFAICMIVAGVLNLVYAAAASKLASGWGWSLALGILDIVAGVWLLCLPAAQLTAVFMFVIGAWILVVAINSLCEACVMSSFSPAWFTWMIVMLIITFVLAVMFLSNPLTGGTAVWLYLGCSFVFYGIFRIILSFRLKSADSLIERDRF